MQTAPPAVSRETRMLLFVIVVSIAVLWVLARIRFPERVATPNPVTPVLAQLVPPSPFESISETVARLAAQLDGSLLAVDSSSAHLTALGEPVIAALRFQSDLAVALPPTADDRAIPPASLVARDRPTSLCVVRVSGPDAPPLHMWSSPGTQSPRFLFAATVSRRGVSFRPLFVGALYPTRSALWADRIWSLPIPVDVAPGTFLFSAEGAFAGLAVEHDGHPAIVPADTVLRAAVRLATEGNRPAGYLGINVQPLTADLAGALGSTTGLIVSWVDPAGPAAGQVRATDLIEQVAGSPVASLDAWSARTERLVVGQALTLAIRRGDVERTLQLTTTPQPAGENAPEPARGSGELGLALRSIRGEGVEITRVSPGSIADRAGLEVGDLITIAGDTDAPTAAQLQRSFARLADRQSLILAVTRGDSHRVVALDRGR